MDVTGRIIQSLQKEEVRYYKLYSSRIQTTDRKDVKLFDLIRKGGETYNEDAIIKKLYPEGEGNRNAYYRLRNRLTTDLSKCMLSHHFQEDDHIFLLNQVSLSRLYESRGEHELALWYLKKAEAKATSIENYEILDIVFGELLKLSHDSLSINPEEYIQKRKVNQERINQLRSIDDITAVLSYRLKISQNFSDENSSVIDLLQKTVNEYTNDDNITSSPKFQFRIYNAVSQILLTQRDYKSLEGYLLKTYKLFSQQNLFNKTNHDTKLQMLTYLVNSLFKNNKLKESLKYTKALHEAMKEFNNLHYEKYVFFYYNSLVINYSKLDKHKALDLLEDLLKNNKLKGSPFYEVFIHLNMAILHFDLKNVRESLSRMGQLNQLSSYRKADRSLRLKISVAELIIRYTAGDIIYLEYLIKKIRKEFKEFLLSNQFNKEKDFLHVVSIMTKSVDLINDIKSKKVIINYLTKYGISEVEDNEVINYGSWLKSLCDRNKIDLNT